MSFDPTKLQTLGFRAVVKVLDHNEEKETKSGIVLLPKPNPKKVYQCEIIRLSQYFKNGKLPDDAPYKPDIGEGDIVYVENRYIQRLQGQTEYGLINIYDIIGKEYW